MSYARKLLLTSNSTTNSTPPQFSPSPPQSTEAAVALESEFAVLLAALLCAIICVLGLVVVARCAWLRRGSDGRRFGFSGGNRLANKGLKKKVLEALPKYTHNSDSAATMEEAVVVEDCAICLAEYVDGDQIRVLPQCGHRFHVECIDMWLGSHSSCPSCRQILVVNRCRKCGEVSKSGGGDGDGGSGGGGCVVDKSSPVSAASTSTPTFFV